MILSASGGKLAFSASEVFSYNQEMLKVLEKERKERYLQTIPETIRVVLGEHFRKSSTRSIESQK